MKQTFLALVLLLNFPFAATRMSIEDAQIFSEFYTYVSQVPLPDGMSVFGNYAPGSGPFDFDHMNEDVNTAYIVAVEMSRLLGKPNTVIKDRNQQIETIKESYDFLIAELYRLNPSVIIFFQRLLHNSELYAGVSVAIPKQPERAAFYTKLLRWRVFKDPKPEAALEAIRIERERLDAIAAEEEAKRKAEIDAKAAELAARAAMEVATKKKLTDDTATILRHRRVTKTNDRREEDKQPLLRPINAH